MRKLVLILTATAAILACGTGAASADTASAEASSAQRPSSQPNFTTRSTPGPTNQQQNQKDRAQERLQDLAEEEEDVLNILD